MGQLEELAESMLQTGPFSYSDESVVLMNDIVDALAASFTVLRISNAPAADEYPSEVLSYSDSPLSLGGGISAGAMDVHVEVFVTGDDAIEQDKEGCRSQGRSGSDRAVQSVVHRNAEPPRPYRHLHQCHQRR